MRNQSKNSAARSAVRSPASTADARSGWKRLDGSRPSTSTSRRASASTATMMIAISSGIGISPKDGSGLRGQRRRRGCARSAHRREGAFEPLAELHLRLPAELLARTTRVDRDALHLAGALGCELGLELLARAAHFAQHLDELEHRRLDARPDVVRARRVGLDR